MSTSSADTGNQLLRVVDLADCVVVCGDTEFNVRRDIICRGSSVLKQFCEEGLQVRAVSSGNGTGLTKA